MKKLVFLGLLTASLLLAWGCNKDDDGDKNNPYIELLGANPLYWSQGVSPYVDPGAKAWDITETNDTINITYRLEITDNVDVNTAGDYEVRFNVSDEFGNKAEEQIRIVKVILTR